MTNLAFHPTGLHHNKYSREIIPECHHITDCRIYMVSVLKVFWKGFQTEGIARGCRQEDILKCTYSKDCLMNCDDFVVCMSWSDCVSKPWQHVRRSISSCCNALNLVRPISSCKIVCSIKGFVAVLCFKRSAGEKPRWYTSSACDGRWTTFFLYGWLWWPLPKS